MAKLGCSCKQIEWADAEDRTCVEKFARALEICWGGDKRYWTFKLDALKSGERIEIAELLDVCWLDVLGKFNTSDLTPNTNYEVLFDIKMNCNSSGFGSPVKFSLKSAAGTIKECEKTLNGLSGNFSWVEIPIGRFNTGHCGIGEIEFKLSQLGGHWKRGLVVRGVIIRAV